MERFRIDRRRGYWGSERHVDAGFANELAGEGAVGEVGSSACATAGEADPHSCDSIFAHPIEAFGVVLDVVPFTAAAPRPTIANRADIMCKNACVTGRLHRSVWCSESLGVHGGSAGEDLVCVRHTTRVLLLYLGMC